MSVEMTREARAARARYMRAWRAANREKVRATNQRYWQRRVDREKQASAGGDGREL